MVILFGASDQYIMRLTLVPQLMTMLVLNFFDVPVYHVLQILLFMITECRKTMLMRGTGKSFLFQYFYI